DGLHTFWLHTLSQVLWKAHDFDVFLPSTGELRAKHLFVHPSQEHLSRFPYLQFSHPRIQPLFSDCRHTQQQHPETHIHIYRSLYWN
ncbi:hypothetical protein KUCAC02_007035, partial [Chaenocephalus aceratus]